MPQSFCQIYVHLIFSTKERRRWLDDAIRPRIHAYLATVARDCGCPYEDVKRYIEGQVEHHRKQTFEEELRAFLDRYNILYDEKYLWD